MVYVRDDLIRDPNFTNEDVAVWCYVNMMEYSALKTNDLTSSARIAYQMFNTLDINHGITDRITASLQYLIETKMLLGKRVSKQYYDISNKTFNTTLWEHFTKVDESAIRRIFSEHKRPFAILRYYLLMLTTIDTKTKVGTWKSETLADLLKIDVTTLTRYYKAMEKLELIYIYRGIHSSNTYGRFENKDLIIAAGNKRTDGKQIKTAANHRRQMTQWYNQIKRCNPKYTEDVYIMEEVREYCETTNEQEMELAAQKPHYVPKLYDMSIFS